MHVFHLSCVSWVWMSNFLTFPPRSGPIRHWLPWPPRRRGELRSTSWISWGASLLWSVETSCDCRVSARSESISTELAATLSHVFQKRIYFDLHLQVIYFSLSRFLTWAKTVDSLIYKWFTVYDIYHTIKNCWMMDIYIYIWWYLDVNPRPPVAQSPMPAKEQVNGRGSQSQTEGLETVGHECIDNILSRVAWTFKDVACLGPFGRFPWKDRKIWAIRIQ